MPVSFSFPRVFALIFSAHLLSAAAQVGPVEDTPGPIRLRQPVSNNASLPADGTKPEKGKPQGSQGPRDETRKDLLGEDEDRQEDFRTKYQPNEFERFVQTAARSRKPIRRLGSDLLTTEEHDAPVVDLSPVVPPDYVVTPGDEVLVAFWGSVDADFRLLVDRAGRITIPRVGAVQVAGVRHADLPATIRRRAGQVFKNFEVSATLGQIRGARIFVTGAVQRPGTYHLSSLSTAIGALIKAGGPSSSGSFRDIQIRRGDQVLARVDLYDLLLKGDRSTDRVLQSGDVVHVGPLGAQVGVIGSVNNQAVVELKPGETVDDAIRMAGGFASLADRGRIALEPLNARNSTRTVEVPLPQGGNRLLAAGDVLRVFSQAADVLPINEQNKQVRVEGEVRRPGDYILPPNSSLADAIQAAGGMTEQAYVFGTEFSRESVRRGQVDNYERALRDLETEMSRSNAGQRTINADQAAAAAASLSAGNRLIERLRKVRPTGRIVLQLDPDAKELPPLALEDGDKVMIPARPTTVGVFGSVFNSGSYLLGKDSKVSDMLKLAGGPTRGADTRSLFIIRMNGSTHSERQSDGWFSAGGKVMSLAALPGDTVFVPEELNRTTFTQEAKEWTQILYQFGLGAAALRTIRN